MNNKRLIVFSVSGAAALLLAVAGLFVVRGVRKHGKAKHSDKELKVESADPEQTNPDSAN